MAKRVDHPAAPILKRLLGGELKNFNSDDRTVWGRFLLAQWYRSPEMIEKLRREGREHMVRALEANPEEYQPLTGLSPNTSLVEFVDAHLPGYDEIATMGNVLPDLVNDQRAGEIIINMRWRWQVLHLLESKVDLLISDRALTLSGGLNSPNCLITIPLDPRHLFVATHRDRWLPPLSPTEIARRSNFGTVVSAYSRVYGTGPQFRPLVEKWLCRQDTPGG
jgi:hypothetical protein